MNSEELLYVLALQHVPNLGDITAKKLLGHFGNAQNIFRERPSILMKMNGVGKAKLEQFNKDKHLRAAEAELEFILRHKIDCHYFQGKNYPERLKHCVDGPILLFSRGNLDLSKRRMLSIVGTRQVTAHGTEFCEKLVEDLAPLNPMIISGFAYGVDITAHKSAMKHKLQTLACLAHGLNQIYPKPHMRYMKEMEENGGFITDFWSSDSFDRNNFLKRNRIIAGMSEATIVIESAEKGGALVTADIADSYNREVFAVPGRPRDKFSEGCNNLIKSQRAHLLDSVADLIYILNWEIDEKPSSVQKQLFVELEEDEKKIIAYLHSNGKTELDLLALNCNFTSNKTASLLLNMELKGVIRPLPGKFFESI